MLTNIFYIFKKFVFSSTCKTKRY